MWGLSYLTLRHQLCVDSVAISAKTPTMFLSFQVSDIKVKLNCLRISLIVFFVFYLDFLVWCPSSGARFIVFRWTNLQRGIELLRFDSL